MKIEVIKGKIDDKGVGETIEVDNKNAARLIKLGYAKEVGDTKTDEPHPQTGGGGTPSITTDGGKK